MSKLNSKKTQKKYWYKIYVGECLVCGRNAGYRERVYGEKPELAKERYIILPDSQTYDGCIR